MFELTKVIRFEASHILPSQGGKCSRLHGHSWLAELILQREYLDNEGRSQGMVQDFGDVKAAVQPLVDEKLDHWHLNDTTGLANPTSEELSRWIYESLKEALPLLVAVRVHETCTSSCEYRP